MSETLLARNKLSSFCFPPTLDIGFGGSAITPAAITLDLPKPYCPSLEGHKQILRGDARSLPFICDDAFASLYSSHLVEDFSYPELVLVLKEWRRILRVGGLLVINAPDQQRFLAHCARTGQSTNANHKEADFSLETFRKVLWQSGEWLLVYENPDDGVYSWHLVVKKI